MSNKVKEYYNENYEREWDRLSNPYSKVEFLSTLYLIDKYFPKEGHIADIGSGPGRYSIELLKKGHKVTLFELSNQELDLAKKTIEKENLKAEAYICEDALKEVTKANFKILSYAGAEGFLAGLSLKVNELFKSNPVVYNNLLKVSAQTCEASQYRDATEYLHIVVKK